MLVLPILSALALIGLPLVSSKHVVVEERYQKPHLWKRSTTPLDPDTTVFTLHFGLQQQNLHLLEDELFKVSDPESEDYGNHWSQEKVKEFFQPSQESMEKVTSWLKSAGHHDHSISHNEAWISVELTVGEAQELLDTQYHLVENQHQDHEAIACDSYSVPEDIRDHIELIKPTLHFDQPISLRRRSLPTNLRRGRRSTHHEEIARSIQDAAPKKRVRPTASAHQGSIVAAIDDRPQPSAGNATFVVQSTTAQLANCVNITTPLCLQTLYGFTNYTPVGTGKSLLGVTEYPPASYIPSDLNRVFQIYTQIPVGTAPIFLGADEAYLNFTYDSFYVNGESNLDLTYAIALTYPLQVSLYMAGPQDNGGSFNNVLDAIDKAYCVYLGGDDASQDGIYTPAGCGNLTRPEVLSTSYNYNEADLTAFYMTRQCNEYGKLGLLGTTVLYSSGDHGVAGTTKTCFTPGTGATVIAGANDPGQQFNPSFPSSCPFVTAVGATQIQIGKLATDPSPEVAAYSQIQSGGGFSTVFPIPSWQNSSVQNYYANYAPPYGASQYNNSRAVRGYPDISANGANYISATNNILYKISGTSASTPTFASIIALVNDARHAKGKGSVGFINPALYSAAFQAALTDITVGTNPGCNTTGFAAVPGWDPVTGLGTPKFQQLKALWVAMK